MNSAIILAGGRGKRMGSDVSKQYILINNKPILYYTLKKFINNDSIDEVILVLPEDEIEYCKKEILKKYNLEVNKIVCGGKERQDSVLNGLRSIENGDIVLIHDGARPFVSDRIITDGINFAKEFKAVAPGVMPKDTIKVKNDYGISEETLNREKLVAVQTPQIFDYNLILSCHEKVKLENMSVTDDTMVVESFGNKVFLYDGEYTNIKITTPEDLILGEHLAKNIE